ncbi:MAG TPA: hypothetical protein VKC59_08235 [Candidatus Limnocylindrales bacterium]|nr:hypothetical protein [Candidatus Limnocylindrales bacterium]
MDTFGAMFLITLITSIFAALGLASSLWGFDSRPGMGDDHAR